MSRTLHRRIRRLEALTVLGFCVLLLAAMRPRADVVTASLLRIVDAQDRPRFLIGAPLPNPQVQGTVYPRARPVPGIMFLDSLGNETGGLGIFDDLQGGGLCFDYATAEAVCLVKAAKPGLTYLNMMAPPAAGARVGQTGPERLQLGLVKGAATLTLSDPQGRARLRLAVDSLGVPAVEVLDEQGTVIRRMP